MSGILVKLSPQEAYRRRKIRLVYLGIFYAWLSSITCVTQGICNSVAAGFVETTVKESEIITIIIAVTLLGLIDIVGGIWSLLWFGATGRSLKEIGRMLKFKPSRLIFLASVIAGPFATGAWMSSANYCGLTITLAIMSITPILSAAISRVVFKEKMSIRVYIGICVAVCGIIIATWSPPEGLTGNFYFGVALALLAPIGFVSEGMLTTYASDMIDPVTGCGIYRCFGAGISGLVLITAVAAIAGDASLPKQIISMVFTDGTCVFWIITAGLSGAVSYGSLYAGFNMCGPARAHAVVNTTSVWSIPLGFLFTALGVYEYVVSAQGIIGAIVIICGITLILAKPSELFRLRTI